MEFELEGFEYKASKIDAMKQAHIVRKLAPVIAEFAPKGDGERTAFEHVDGLASALSKMDDATFESVMYSLLACIKRKEAQGLGWSKITTGTSLMYADIDFKVMLQLAWQALQFNFGDFFGALTSTLNGANQKASGKLVG